MVTPLIEPVARLIESYREEARDDEVAELIDMVERFAASPTCARLARAERAHTELPFSFELPTGGGRGLLVNGIVDVHAREAGGTLVVDYKSDRLGDLQPAELVESSYATQRIVYALAALRSGAESVEVAYVLLERPEDVVAATYRAADAEDLERRLRELAAGVVEGRFEPSPAPWRGLCGDCPGQPALCSWEPERTLAPEPAR